MISTRDATLRAAILFAALSGPGCGHDGGVCVSRSSERIYGGAETPSGGALTNSQMRAVGSIENDVGALYCTGVVVSESWVLSARHCSSTQPGMFLRLAALGVSGPRLRLGTLHTNPSDDLALYELLDGDLLDEFGVQALAIGAAGAIHPVNPGDSLTLAGVGLTQDGSRGELRFVDEVVSKVEADTITVDGRGRTGACDGDSGGPLLRRSSDGFAEVLGVLSKGSASCMGIDVYTRLDASAAWLGETMARYSNGSTCVTD